MNMDVVSVLLSLSLIYYEINSVSLFCLSGCSCTNDGFGRSLLCMEAALRRIPENIPRDFIKIRIENSHLNELPRGLFFKVSALRFLWLNFNEITVMNMRSLEGLNNLTELRLQGNKLSSVPWTAFQDTPNLKILDLKHNRLDVLPENALRHLPSLTYLDLSFNKLTVVSRDVILNWPLYHRSEKHGYHEESSANVFLAFHENPWLCDCRLKGFVEFIRSVNPPIILMNSYLSCSAPSFRAGKFFHEVHLKTCTKPVVTAPVSNFTRPLGFNVTLACIATGRPDPAIQWTYGLKIIRGFTESQVQVDDGTIKSELVIHSLHLGDSGIYTCTASNFIGNSSASILMNVQPLNISSLLSPSFPVALAEENVYVDVRIAKQTVYGITLEWRAVTENPAETWYTIHFSRLDDARKETIYIGPGINSYTISDLLPVTKYEVCVTLKNQAPRSGQCVVFMTGSDVRELEQKQRLVHVVVVVCAMALAVPAGMYACAAETKLRWSDRCGELCRRRPRMEKGLKAGERQATFHSLWAHGDDGLGGRPGDDGGPRAKPDDRGQKVKAENRSVAELY